MSRLRELRDEIDKLRKENAELKEALADYKGAYLRSLQHADIFRERHEQEIAKRIALEVEIALKELVELTTE